MCLDLPAAGDERVGQLPDGTKSYILFVPAEDFHRVLERTWNHVNELQERGADLGDIPARLEEAQIAWDQDRVDEAKEILQGVHEDLRRIQAELRESQEQAEE